MDILSVVIIAIGLAMDCFAVSVSTGIEVHRWSNGALLMALLFGLFQGGMPMIGFLAGISFAEQISRYDHWIALVLLGFIGGKMIWESLRSDDALLQENAQCHAATFGFYRLIGLALATSIDALATGVIFVPTPGIMGIAVAIIALVSFLFSLGGYLVGMVFGKRFHLNMTLIGGIILIGIGVKIFIEHIWIKGC